MIAQPIKPITTDTREIELHRCILKELGYELSRAFAILDFGCGDGEMVRRYRDEGFNAFGADIKIETKSDFLRVIRTKEVYRIPFPPDTFDFVYSHEVFEHVKDFRSALSEIHRVLKPGGISLHVFPPKFRPIEAHVFVPSYCGLF
jgi:SAM-dependent methyltransferase